jgi:hypothetical protein
MFQPAPYLTKSDSFRQIGTKIVAFRPQNS